MASRWHLDGGEWLRCSCCSRPCSCSGRFRGRFEERALLRKRLSPRTLVAAAAATARAHYLDKNLTSTTCLVSLGLSLQSSPWGKCDARGVGFARRTRARRKRWRRHHRDDGFPIHRVRKTHKSAHCHRSCTWTRGQGSLTHPRARLSRDAPLLSARAAGSSRRSFSRSLHRFSASPL